MLAIAVTMLVSCAEIPVDTSSYHGQKGYASLYQLTQERLAQSRALDGEWTGTQTLIDLAEAAAKKGDYQAANSYLREAYFQANASYQQQRSQENVGNPAYLPKLNPVK